MLDPFQKESLRCIENMQSVLVSAHTSAGKTVVAEYAIAMSLRDTQRVIYTTPIKVGIIWHLHIVLHSKRVDSLGMEAKKILSLLLVWCTEQNFSSRK